MADVLAVVQEGWREILARVHARDVADLHSEMASFKIGEASFIDVPPKVPDTPDPALRDLMSEGEALAGGGTATFTNLSVAVVGVGTTFLADLSVGDWIKPGPTASGFVNSAGVPGTEVDVWGEVTAIANDTNLTLVAPYAGATLTRAVRKAPEPFFTFRKALVNADVLFSSGVPAVTEITAIVLAAEANADQLLNSPEFFEIGIFDANGVMLIHMTFPAELKTGAVQLNHLLELVF